MKKGGEGGRGGRTKLILVVNPKVSTNESHQAQQTKEETPDQDLVVADQSIPKRWYVRFEDHLKAQDSTHKANQISLASKLILTMEYSIIGDPQGDHSRTRTTKVDDPCRVM